MKGVIFQGNTKGVAMLFFGESDVRFAVAKRMFVSLHVLKFSNRRYEAATSWNLMRLGEGNNPV